MSGIRLTKERRRAIFKALDGLVRRYHMTVFSEMRRYLMIQTERRRALREIAQAEKRMAELRRKLR